MDFEFDKEIDALLRQTARSETVSAGQNSKLDIQNSKLTHLDADELSAFAENALPEKAKQNRLRHLADCHECRKNLSSLISLNSEQPIEVVQNAEKQFVETPVAWHRKLFAFPNLAFTMGALVLVFSGIVAYTVLQSGSNAPNAEISQTYERQPNGKGMSSDGDAPPTESYPANAMMSNAASTNSAMNTSAAASVNPAKPAAPPITGNANMTAMQRESDKNMPAEPKSAAPNQSSVLTDTQGSVIVAAPSPIKKSAQENSYQLDGESEKRLSQNSTSQKQSTESSGAGSLQSAPKAATRADAKSKKLEELKDDARKESIETTTVGGKNFKRGNNVWYDSAYRGQSTINVTRGTSNYKKLDANLRGIAENLGGTIVVVWKEKAYRIQ